MRLRISIKELHRSTGEHVRRAARSPSPHTKTERRTPVAILARPALLSAKPRKRTLLAEYKALLARKSSGDILDDLDAVRGDR
jgi:hypothetical protein